ncbi:phage tail sheath subtilisin-like domain-containing protein [Palleronia sp.]|uniref:phage tail sheath subtilisin-like domain-containing protein n=1 Tax=Palleronia sp. TaxID=1940284 RepID=UPI0035C7E87F
MAEPFSGVRVFQDANEPVIPQPVGTSTIGMIQAVTPADLPSGISLNTPIAIRNPSDAADLPAAVKEELDTVWDNDGGTVVLTFVDAGIDVAALTANAQGDATMKTGVHAFRKATSLGLPKPKIFPTAGIAYAGVAQADAIIAELATVVDDMRGFIFADGPGTTIANAITAAGLIANKRVTLTDDKILKSVAGIATAKPSSTLFAAVQSNLDRTRNVAWPATNVQAQGIIGVNRPVDFGTEVTPLNEAGVSTVINRGNGFEVWGPKTTAANEAGSIWQFLNVVRVADYVNETLEEAFYSFMGRPMVLDTLDLMTIAGQRLLRRLEGEGVLLAGSRFGLAANQTAEDGVQGIVKFGLQYEPPAPIYDLRIQAYRNPIVAYEALFDSVAGRFVIAEAA